LRFRPLWFCGFYGTSVEYRKIRTIALICSTPELSESSITLEIFLASPYIFIFHTESGFLADHNRQPFESGSGRAAFAGAAAVTAKTSDMNS
jgi:hypothetical protein